MRPPSAIRSHPVLALLPVVILVAFGVTLGLRRHPVYSASSEVSVGVASVSAQATPGYVEAAQLLASAYSRQVASRAIYQLISNKTGLSVSAVAVRLSSSAVPSSPTFFINATGPSPSAAIKLTKTAVAALRYEINVVQQGRGNPNSLLRRYTRAQDKANLLSDQQTMLQDQPDATTPAGKVKLRAAKLKTQVAVLQAQILSGQYTQASTTTSGGGATIEVLNPASTAASDRSSVTERYGLIGAAAGVVLGALLALLVAHVRPSRFDDHTR